MTPCYGCMRMCVGTLVLLLWITFYYHNKEIYFHSPWSLAFLQGLTNHQIRTDYREITGFTKPTSALSNFYHTSTGFPRCLVSTTIFTRVSGLLLSLSITSCKTDSASSYLPWPIKHAAWPLSKVVVLPYLSINSWNI